MCENRKIKKRVLMMILAILMFGIYVEAMASHHKTPTWQNPGINEVVGNNLGIPAALPGRLLRPKKKGKVTVSSKFVFHPATPWINTKFDKNTVAMAISGPSPAYPLDPLGNTIYPDGVVAAGPGSVLHTYYGSETHGTDGLVEHSLSLVAVGKRVRVVDNIFGSIWPGVATNRLVSLRAKMRDPFTFSDTDPDSSFYLDTDPLESSLSLFSGTAFPGYYSSDGIEGGALVSGTSMSFGARVVPTSISEPNLFWADGVAGAIDMFKVDISSDRNHNITTNIIFGEGTSDFGLTFTDHLGNSFDPTDPVAVALIEDYISGAFLDGALTGDLTDIIIATFDSRDDISEFTAGSSNGVTLAAVEVPEPATICLLGIGGLALRRKRRA